MATYTFESITQAQATTYGASDVLVFASGAANRVWVGYEVTDATADNPEGTSVVISHQGKVITFPISTIGGDTLTFADGSVVRVGTSADNALVGSDFGDAIFGGNGNDNLYGAGGDDLIHGNVGNDSVTGGSGNDTVLGGQGNDSLLGNTGNDYLLGNLGTDTIFGGLGDDTILGGQGNDLLYGEDGNDRIEGGLGDDYIEGNDGNDILNGDAGDDTIEGGLGQDTMTGGAGNDVFVYDNTLVGAESPVGTGTAAGSLDLILGWEVGDTIDVGIAGGPLGVYTETASTLAWDDLVAAVDSEMAGAGGLTSTADSEQIVVVQQGANVYVFVDMDGLGGADLAIRLNGTNLDAISGANFV